MSLTYIIPSVQTWYGVQPIDASEISVCQPPSVRFSSSFIHSSFTLTSMAAKEPSRLKISANSAPKKKSLGKQVLGPAKGKWNIDLLHMVSPSIYRES